jgi:hypothetical protein
VAGERGLLMPEISSAMTRGAERATRFLQREQAEETAGARSVLCRASPQKSSPPARKQRVKLQRPGGQSEAVAQFYGASMIIADRHMPQRRYDFNSADRCPFEKGAHRGHQRPQQSK